MRAARDDLRQLLEVAAVIVVTWLLLGWYFDRPIAQADASVLVAPYVQSALDAGGDWTAHLYRTGVVGGSKMHEFAGTPLLLQLCAALGISATTTMNLMTLVVQLGFAFFGLLGVSALVARWSPDRSLGFPERVVCTWAIAFAPLLAWRLAVGHDNLLEGLLPFWCVLHLLLVAQVRAPSGVALVVATLTIGNGLSGLGPQTIAYTLVFGTIVVACVVATTPAARRWTGAQGAVAACAGAAALLVLPRVVPMLAHATGSDATRALGASVKDALALTQWQDWLASLAWTPEPAIGRHGFGSAHEYHVPLGPWLLLLPLAWRRGRTLVVGVAVATLLAVAYAQGLEPVASSLAFLDAFRVPARAVMVGACLVPLLALAGYLATAPASRWPRSHSLLVLGLCAAAIPLLRHLPLTAGESVAWLLALGLLALVRTRPAVLPHATPALAVIAVLGVVSFDARFPRSVAWDRPEAGPRALRDATLAQVPAARDPLQRVIVMNATAPYAMSTAFVAGLGSIDGVWYPPRRFLDLLSALMTKPLPATTCVFSLGDSRVFPVLQQLYNIGHAIDISSGAITELPAPAGGAWFPTRVSTIAAATDMARELGQVPDVRPLLRTTLWGLEADAAPRSIDPRCEAARVTRVRSEQHGQRIVIDLSSPGDCPLVISTNHVSNLRAIDAAGAPLQVFPADVALTGVLVPADTSRVVLAPAVAIPAWTRVAQLLGLLLLAGALVLAHRSS